MIHQGFSWCFFILSSLVFLLPWEAAPHGVARAQSEGNTQTTIKKTRSKPLIKTFKKRQRIDDLGETVNESSDTDYSKPSGTGLSFFVGVDLGYVTSDPKLPDQESKKTGFNLGFKGLGSIFTNSMVIDIGGGYLISKLSGSKDTLTTNNVKTEIVDVEIDTRIGFFEFSPRYRVTEKYSLGLIGQGFYGQDGRFGPEEPLANGGDQDSKAKNSVATVFGGLTAMFEWMGESIGGRAGLIVLTDINIAERQLLIGELTLQVGIPILKQKTLIERKSVHRLQEKVREKEVEKIVKEIVVKEIVKFQFDSQFINFETDKATLSSQSQNFLGQISQFLNANQTIWEKVIIDGHTDKRGSSEYNLNLSRERAASVRAVLTQNGIAEERALSAGYGFTRPIDDRNIPVAWARNRRVEMTFSNVTDTNALRRGIEAIRNNMSVSP